MAKIITKGIICLILVAIFVASGLFVRADYTKNSADERIYITLEECREMNGIVRGYDPTGHPLCPHGTYAYAGIININTPAVCCIAN